MMKRSIFLASAAALALTGLATAGLAAADKSPAPTNASGAILTNVKAGTPTRNARGAPAGGGARAAGPRGAGALGATAGALPGISCNSAT